MKDKLLDILSKASIGACLYLGYVEGVEGFRNVLLVVLGLLCVLNIFFYLLIMATVWVDESLYKENGFNPNRYAFGFVVDITWTLFLAVFLSFHGSFFIAFVIGITAIMKSFVYLIDKGIEQAQTE